MTVNLGKLVYWPFRNFVHIISITIITITANAAPLPTTFNLDGSYNIVQQGINGAGLGNIRFSQDGNLWLFGVPAPGTSGDITAIDPLNSNFFDGDDLFYTLNRSEFFQGNFFDNTDRLISFSYGDSNVTIRNSSDGVFFNSNDIVTYENWQFADGGIRGTAEPAHAVQGQDGLIYSTAAGICCDSVTTIGVFDPITHTYTSHDLQIPNFSGWGLTFDGAGHLFIADPVNTGKLIGIDSVNGTFFDGDDIFQTYNINMRGFYDIAFGSDGRLYAIDQQNNFGLGEDVVVALTPYFGDIPPVLLAEPKILELIAISFLAFGALRYTRQQVN